MFFQLLFYFILLMHGSCLSCLTRCSTSSLPSWPSLPCTLHYSFLIDGFTCF